MRWVQEQNGKKTEGRVGELRTVETTQSEQHREVRLKKLTEPQGHVDNNKRSNICIFRIPEGYEKGFVKKYSKK